MENWDYWQILASAGVFLIILEMLTPTMFFLNLALACLLTAVVSVWTANLYLLTGVWVAGALVFWVGLRPFLMRKKTVPVAIGMERYRGVKAVVSEDIDANGGVIRVFDERWKARSSDGSFLVAGTPVIIEKNDDLTMIVRKDG